VEPVNDNPTLQDVWGLLGTMNRRFSERFDTIERQFVELEERLGGRISSLEARVTAGFGALKGSIEARDFRLDEQARRIAELEKPQ
jgi:hypothetical protein